MARVISSTAGTRIEPPDTYKFLRGTTVKFKITFVNNGVPTTVNTGTSPTIDILRPAFLNKSGSGLPDVIASIQGALVSGQDYEYEFSYDVPAGIEPLDNYLVRYNATIGATTNTFADEYFAVVSELGQIGVKKNAYATVADVRKRKFNIDDYLPVSLKKDAAGRDDLIQSFLEDATVKLREELSLFKQRGHSENYRLFAIYYTIWSIMLSARGEDGSSVSDRNLSHWQREWQRILAQEKREGVMQGIPLGRG